MKKLILKTDKVSSELAQTWQTYACEHYRGKTLTLEHNCFGLFRVQWGDDLLFLNEKLDNAITIFNNPEPEKKRRDEMK